MSKIPKDIEKRKIALEKYYLGKEFPILGVSYAHFRVDQIHVYGKRGIGYALWAFGTLVLKPAANETIEIFDFSDEVATVSRRLKDGVTRVEKVWIAHADLPKPPSIREILFSFASERVFLPIPDNQMIKGIEIKPT